jgi:hypothetical protein
MTVRRRPLRRDDLHLETTLTRYAQLAPEIELGWTQLRQAMRDAGWPARTPTDDRRPSTGQNQEPSSLDYSDVTGDMAMRLDDLANDLEAMQDHRDILVTSCRALAALARKYIPAPPDVVTAPKCSVLSCDNPVEKTPSGTYRGVELVAGHWAEKPGVRPLCAKHRTAQRRDIA